MHDQPNFTGMVRDLWNTRGGLSPSDGEKEYSWIPMIRLAKVISRKQGPANQTEKNRNPTPEALLAANGPAYVVNRYKSNLRIIRSVCREYGIKCYFVWHPVPFYKYDRSLHRTFPYEGPIPKHWSATYKTMKFYSSPDFLYLGESLVDVREKVFVDDVHFNEKFNAEIAAAICGFLKPDLDGFVFR
jgi:hypothetical protein